MFYSKKTSLFIFLISLSAVHPEDEKVPRFDDITKFDSETYCMFQSYTRSCSKKPNTRSYYYDLTRKECVLTDYGHCKHAYNNHLSRDLCKTQCKESSITHQKNFSITNNVFCRFQPDFGNCYGYFPSFYFDINTNTCKGFSYSGCGGNANKFPSAKECISQCNPYVTHEPAEE